MNEAAKQASLIVESVAKAVANWVVARHAELDPGLHIRYGARWRDEWVGHVESQVHFLAQSIAVRRPKLFADSACWMRYAFRERGMYEADLLTSLRCMREMVAEELPAAVAGTAGEYVGQAIEEMQAASNSETDPLAVGGPHQEVVLRYLEAVLDGRKEEAENVIFGAVDAGLAVDEVYDQVLQPAQIELGLMWQRGEINVSDEHLGSAAIHDIMSILHARFSRRPTNGKLVVAASVGGELHDIGIRMVADFFEMDGWNVICLGANTPSSDLVCTLGDRRACLLAVSASTVLHIRALGELIEQVRADASCAATKVIVGGRPFLVVPDLWIELGADGCAPSASEAVRLGNSLVSVGG